MEKVPQVIKKKDKWKTINILVEAEETMAEEEDPLEETEVGTVEEEAMEEEDMVLECTVEEWECIVVECMVCIIKWGKEMDLCSPYLGCK